MSSNVCLIRSITTGIGTKWYGASCSPVEGMAMALSSCFIAYPIIGTVVRTWIGKVFGTKATQDIVRITKIFKDRKPIEYNKFYIVLTTILPTATLQNDIFIHYLNKTIRMLPDSASNALIGAESFPLRLPNNTEFVLEAPS